MRQKVRLEAEKAEAVARIKVEIKANDQRAVELAQHYETGIEWRDIECENVMDFEHACVRTFRRDTNEVLRTRIMKAEERQAALDFETGAVDQGEQLEGMRAAPDVGAGEPGPGDGDEDDDDDDDSADDGESTGAVAH
jgi:hypothetical protein